MTSSSCKSLPASRFQNFSLKLFDSVSQDTKDQNIFLSPVSIALAMSMCTVGARKETLEQMLRTLEASSVDELKSTAEQVMQVLAIADQDKQVTLKLVNRLYAQKNYKLQDEYVQIVQSLFQADIKLEDFVHEGHRAVQTINTWVEKQTNKLIRNLLSPNDVSSDTRLILVNCIYFKGSWVRKFREYNTDKNADFHQSDGSVSKIELMYQKERHAYFKNEDLGVQIAHLPYKSDSHDVQFVFTIILPNQNVPLEKVERQLASNPKFTQKVLSQQGTIEELLLYLPKFKMEAQFHLNDVLIRLGMQNAFDERRADFTGIVGDDKAGLFISKVIHKAFIDVNEEGSEAAAATVVDMRYENFELREERVPIEFKADRPFLFFIRESRQNIILFSGKFIVPPIV